MSKLKCVSHGRRVVVLPSSAVYHRAGNGELCVPHYGTGQLQIHHKLYTNGEIAYGNIAPKPEVKVSAAEDTPSSKKRKKKA